VKQYKILSLDIWDTVLRRKCHPDEIKLATARFLYLTCYQKLKVDYRDVQKLLLSRIAAERTIANQRAPEYDDEYSIRDVFARTLSDALETADNLQEVVERLYAFELNKEVEMTYLDPHIVETISQYNYEKLGYISDFYAGTDFLDTLLEHVGFPLEFSFKYVSCEHMLNKRSGRLFQKVLSDLRIEPEEQLHIGDNAYSDHAVPESLGINTLRYLPLEEHNRRKSREQFYSIESGHIMERINDEMYYGTGTSAILAPFFVSFVLWILEECIKRGIRKVYYFTREGEFFVRLHEVIAQSDLFPRDILPQANVLEVSRVATFAASLRTVSLDEMMRLWNQYSIQSMQAFGKSVALEDEKFRPWLDKYGVPMDEVITYPWLDDRIQKLFLDSDFIEFFQSHINSLRERLLQYAYQKGLEKERPEDIAIVDIGWRGSIQDNLCYIFSEHKIVGY